MVVMPSDYHVNSHIGLTFRARRHSVRATKKRERATMSDLTVLASGLGFPEGPVAMPDGSVILGEISGSRVTRVAPDGSKTEIGRAGGGPNGVAVGPDGALYVCNNGGNAYANGGFLSTGPATNYVNGSIQRIDIATGETRTLYTEANGHKLSAPNDIVFDAHGGFYFTDLGKRYDHQRDHGGLYYALPDGSKIIELVYPIVTPNGVGLSPDGRMVYVADTETSRLYAFDIVSPGVLHHEPFPSAHGGRVVCGLPGFQRFDSLALEANGNICVATLITGYITVIAPDGHVVRQVKMPDVYPTNICFGGADRKTAFITLSGLGQLVKMDWPEAGLKLNFGM
jgi:gluconolactonase